MPIFRLPRRYLALAVLGELRAAARPENAADLLASYSPRHHPPEGTGWVAHAYITARTKRRVPWMRPWAFYSGMQAALARLTDAGLVEIISSEGTTARPQWLRLAYPDARLPLTEHVQRRVCEACCLRDPSLCVCCGKALEPVRLVGTPPSKRGQH